MDFIKELESELIEMHSDSESDIVNDMDIFNVFQDSCILSNKELSLSIL